MKEFVTSIKTYAVWLSALSGMDLFFALLLWLSDARAFQTLLILIILWSLIFFLLLVIYVSRRDKRKKELFETFINDPDPVHEGKLLQAVSGQERERIRLLALVLGDYRSQLSSLTQDLKEYEEYVESWAHEAKTPLALLTMVLDNRADELPVTLRSRLDYIRSRLQEDITQMLYYARLKSSTKDYRLEPLDLEDILEDVLADYQPLLEEKHFHIKKKNIKGTKVFSDRRGLQFMLGQMISNVIKYSKDRPVLLISVQNTEKEVVLSIADNGKGVTEYDLPYIFQKGFTGDAFKNGNKATGMGLYLTKKMAYDLNLKLEVQSEYEKYFKISISFPLNNRSV